MVSVQRGVCVFARELRGVLPYMGWKRGRQAGEAGYDTRIIHVTVWYIRAMNFK